MVSIGAIYFLIPRLFSRSGMYSIKLIDIHFWLATTGIVLYIAAMWISGVMQGLMWRATNANGLLTYSFIESVEASFPFYVVRFFGGVLFLAGMFVMAGCAGFYHHQLWWFGPDRSIVLQHLDN